MQKLVERRKYIRLDVPCELAYTMPGDDKVYHDTASNISPNGIRIQSQNNKLEQGIILEIRLTLKNVSSPIHAKAKVVWMKRLSLNDASALDVGLEFISIEDDNKNTFLKFLCDSIYNIPKERIHEKVD